MEIRNENGIKWISCDNLGEVIEEFKKFRAAQIAKGQKEEYRNYFFLQKLKHKVIEVEGGVVPKEEIDSAQVYQHDGTDLTLNIASLGLNEKEWTPYGRKVKNILKEIWETGEAKDYQGLDLNWPAVSKMVCCNQCGKNIDGKLAYFSDREKDLDFCSKDCHSKFKKRNALELKEQLEKENRKKKYLMVISIATISVFAFLLLLLILLRKKKTKNNL